MHYAEKRITIGTKKLDVSYIDEGAANAPAIIFIHGFPLNKAMWNKQIAVLKHNYRVVAYDVRGHGNTNVGDSDFSIELFVNDLLGLMDVLKINKCKLCGFSMGGYIALNAVENYADRFEAIILCDTNCIQDTPEAKDGRMKAIESIKSSGLEQYADDSLKKLFAPISFSNQIEEIAIVRNMIVTTAEQSLFKTLHALAERKESCTNLHNINVPALILVGKEDAITSPDVAMSMHEKIKGSTIHIIDNAGHLSNMENPNLFNEQLTKFLKNTT